VDGGEAKIVTLSLHDWIHLQPDERSDYIFKYARSVSEKEVKKMDKTDDTNPKRDVISVSYCQDVGSITSFSLGKTVPRLLGIPHGVHGKIQHPKDGKYEVQWNRVIGYGGLKDLSIEHLRFLVSRGDNDTIYHDMLDVLRDDLCSGNVDKLSEQGKDFVVGCALKWHYLRGSEDIMQHNLKASDEQRENWPKRYMAHMKLWKMAKGQQTWDKFLKTDPVLQYGDPLKSFWAKSKAGDEWKTVSAKPDCDDCFLENCFWEGCVQPHMVLESNAEWIAARQLLGLQSLHDMTQLKTRPDGAQSSDLPEVFDA
jgi:hypothetical protein